MDNSPTALFNNYEQDFQQIIASIRDKVEGNSKSEGVGEYSLSDEWVQTEGCGGLTYASLLLWRRATQDGVEEGGDGIRRG